MKMYPLHVLKENLTFSFFINFICTCSENKLNLLRITNSCLLSHRLQSADTSSLWRSRVDGQIWVWLVFRVGVKVTSSSISEGSITRPYRRNKHESQTLLKVSRSCSCWSIISCSYSTLKVWWKVKYLYFSVILRYLYFPWVFQFDATVLFTRGNAGS